LTSHASVEGALELVAEGEPLELGRLLVVEKDALVGEPGVLQSLEAVDDGPYLGGDAIAAGDGGSDRRRHAVGAITDRGAVRRRHDWARRIQGGRHS